MFEMTQLMHAVSDNGQIQTLDQMQFFLQTQLYVRAGIGDCGGRGEMSKKPLKIKTKLPHLTVPRKILAGFLQAISLWEDDIDT